MADRSLTDLNYGRPGLANYDLENRGWSFSRQPARKHFVQISPWRPVVSAPAALFYEGNSSMILARRKAKHLARDHPELAPASDQLHTLEAVSEAVLSATSTYDPLIGNLLSFGSVFLERSGTALKRIAALPTGESGNILRLVVLKDEKHGWGIDKMVWLSGPSFKDTDSGYWNEDAAPIQQVCFAQTESGNSFLAVRLPMKTVIFNPIYHRGRRAAEPSQHHDLPPSLIDAHPIIRIGIAETGGVPHADVTFNPDYQFQVGIVNQQNSWSIWDIDQTAKDKYSVTCLVHGQIAPPEELISSGEDGWARIVWAGDVNTVLVCNRRHMRIINIQGESFTYLPSPELFSRKSSEWILDVRRHPKHNNRFFILTSMHVIVLSVITPGAAMDRAASEVGATTLLSRRHYRGDEDFTLQLSIQWLSENDVCVFLHSKVNNIIEVYHFQENRSAITTIMHSMDPVVFGISIPEARHATSLRLDPLQFGIQAKSTLKIGPGRSYMDAELQFYQLLVMLPDLSVHQTIVYIPDSEGRTPIPAVERIAWNKVPATKHSLYASKEQDNMRDFIVPDGLINLETPALKAGSQTASFLATEEPEMSIKITDSTLIYAALNFSASATEEFTDIDVIMDRWKHALSDSSLPVPGTLFETSNPNVVVSDIDEASEKLNQLSLLNASRENIELRTIAPATALYGSNSEEPTMTSLYDEILQSWVGTLPAEIPFPLRQRKELLTRRVAAEVMLASSRVRYTDSARPASNHGTESALPTYTPFSQVERDLDANSPWSSESQGPASSALPSSQPSSPLTPSFPLGPILDPLARLREHLHITPQPAPEIPHTVAQLLTHWEIGADPSTYDWDATERALHPDNTFDEPSQEQREKERKRRERREKRQKREDQLMRAKSVSQPSYPRSSPGPMGGAGFASSQVQPQSQAGQAGRGAVGSLGTSFGAGFGSPMPQSQVEPGRFGGRTDKKKKKGKGRISGF